MALPVIVSQPLSTVTEVYNVAVFECIARSYGSVSITWKRWNSKLPVTAHIMTNTSLNEVNIERVLKEQVTPPQAVSGSSNSNYRFLLNFNF